MSDSQAPKLHFEGGFNERDAFEAEARGYRSHVTVELPDGSMHPVVFWDAVRLRQDLEEEASRGNPYIAERGMIVLESVTLENMTMSVRRLAEEGFFCCEPTANDRKKESR